MTNAVGFYEKALSLAEAEGNSEQIMALYLDGPVALLLNSRERDIARCLSAYENQVEKEHSPHGVRGTFGLAFGEWLVHRTLARIIEKCPDGAFASKAATALFKNLLKNAGEFLRGDFRGLHKDFERMEILLQEYKGMVSEWGDRDARKFLNPHENGEEEKLRRFFRLLLLTKTSAPSLLFGAAAMLFLEEGGEKELRSLSERKRPNVWTQFLSLFRRSCREGSLHESLMVVKCLLEQKELPKAFASELCFIAASEAKPSTVKKGKSHPAKVIADKECLNSADALASMVLSLPLGSCEREALAVAASDLIVAGVLEKPEDAIRKLESLREDMRRLFNEKERAPLRRINRAILHVAVSPEVPTGLAVKAITSAHKWAVKNSDDRGERLAESAMEGLASLRGAQKSVAATPASPAPGS